MNELLSVIVPVYNVELYLDQCIDTILKQSYQNFELLLIDDGSSDSSGVMCDEWSKKDNRISVIHKENGGVSSARNVGIEKSRGEFLVFIDSDDYLRNDYLEKLYAAIGDNPDIDVVICRFYNCRQDSKGEYQPEECKSYAKKQRMTGSEILQERFGPQRVLYVLPSNKMYRKTIFQNIRYAEGKNHEDELLASQMYQICNDVICIEEPLYYYRIRPNSIMTACNIKTVKADLDWLISEIEVNWKNDVRIRVQVERMYCHDYVQFMKLLKKKEDIEYKVKARKYAKDVVKNEKLPLLTKLKFYLLSM